mmetsp:Transcript_3344/g.7534  ORF Transcript_3344/g.7534 Transcript_3344/m.7534 type:complete len:185 (+) Transcript_3344:2-556(+)
MVVAYGTVALADGLLRCRDMKVEDDDGAAVGYVLLAEVILNRATTAEEVMRIVPEMGVTQAWELMHLCQSQAARVDSDLLDVMQLMSLVHRRVDDSSQPMAAWLSEFLAKENLVPVGPQVNKLETAEGLRKLNRLLAAHRGGLTPRTTTSLLPKNTELLSEFLAQDSQAEARSPTDGPGVSAIS